MIDFKALSKSLARQPIQFLPGEFNEGDREPKNLWLFRLFGLKPNALNINWLLVGIEPTRVIFREWVGGEIFALDLSPQRIEVMASWAEIELNNDVDDRKKSVAIVICDQARFNFLLQVKDGHCRNKKARGCFCPFAGSPKSREPYEIALAREVFEEIADHEVVEQILDRFERRPIIDVTATQWGNQVFPCFWGISAARDSRQFAHWVDKMVVEGYVAEGAAVVLNRPALRHLIKLEKQTPGATFVNGLHILLEAAL